MRFAKLICPCVEESAMHSGLINFSRASNLSSPQLLNVESNIKLPKKRDLQFCAVVLV